MSKAEVDIRDVLFQDLITRVITAQITVERDGIIAGSRQAKKQLEELGLTVEYLATDGAKANRGEVIACFKGSPKQITSAEDLVMGCIAKTSGIATAARQASLLAAGRIRVVSGAWKKMPLTMKQQIREAISFGGVAFRIADVPFIYLDKNYVRIFGGIKAALEAASRIPERIVSVQLRGETGKISRETEEAVEGGAHILMIDTGKIEDALEVIATLEKMGLRKEKQVAFAGGVKIADIPYYIDHGIDILDIGTQIIDAPLLDMKMDVISA